MRNITFEVCAGSYEDCIAASNGGADRVELNSSLHMGGLTPTVASLQLVKEYSNIQVACMIRPRGAGFLYTKAELAVMRKEAINLLEAGTDAIVFGFLHENRTIDKELTKEFVELAHSYHKEAVFHRAVDCVDDIEKAMEDLITCGVDRVLTSGKEATAYLGRHTLQKLQEAYGSQIEILAGVGVNLDNMEEILESGVTQIHSSCKAWVSDPTSSSDVVDYSYHPDHPNAYEVVEERKVKELKKKIDSLA